MRLFQAFQDIRLMLVPVFLVALHAGMSGLMLYTNSVVFFVLRDVIGTR